jgi:hypothetical protein
MSLERVYSVDPTEVYDYISCGYESNILFPSIENSHVSMISLG